jgi:ABC-type uncharacterized transport system ATPase subunit
MFTLINKNNLFIDSSLRNYIRTSFYQSIQKYIKKDNNIKENSVVVLNELDKNNIKNIQFNNHLINKPEIYGFLLFLSIPTLIHYLYFKK